MPCVASMPWAGGGCRAALPHGRKSRNRPAELLRAADAAQYQAKRGGPAVDVLVAGEAVEDSASTAGRDRAFRASDPDAQLARALLDMLDNMNGSPPRSGWRGSALDSSAKSDLTRWPGRG